MLKKLFPYIVGFAVGVACVMASCFFFGNHGKYHKKIKKFEFVEMVSYKLKKDVKAEDHDKFLYSVNSELKEISPFTARTVSKSGDTYYDVIFWKTKSDFENAQAKAKDSEILQKYIEMIDQTTITSSNSDVVNFYFPSKKNKGKKTDNEKGDEYKKFKEQIKSKIANDDLDDYKDYKKYKKCIKKNSDEPQKCSKYKEDHDEFVKKYGDVYEEFKKNSHNEQNNNAVSK